MRFDYYNVTEPLDFNKPVEVPQDIYNMIQANSAGRQKVFVLYKLLEACYEDKDLGLSWQSTDWLLEEPNREGLVRGTIVGFVPKKETFAVHVLDGVNGYLVQRPNDYYISSIEEGLDKGYKVFFTQEEIDKLFLNRPNVETKEESNLCRS